MLILPIALGALLYGGGYIAQFLYNYDVWQAAGGVFGTAPEFPDGNFFACIAAVFRWPYGLYGVGGCIAALAVLVFMVMRMGYSETGAYDRERNLIYSNKGTYGTAGFMTKKELKGVLDLVPNIRKHPGIILGEIDGEVICVPLKTRFNGNLSSLFLSFIFIKLMRYADQNCPGGALPVPVHVLGEELCACGVIPDLSRKISVIRSRNISMSCVFQNLAGLQNRYPQNQWQEILGNCDITLFLGCTDALTAQFISDRTGEASIAVTNKAKQLGTWRISNYTPGYRETSGVGKRKLMTMDEVLRMDVDRA